MVVLNTVVQGKKETLREYVDPIKEYIEEEKLPSDHRSKDIQKESLQTYNHWRKFVQEKFLKATSEMSRSERGHPHASWNSWRNNGSTPWWAHLDKESSPSRILMAHFEKKILNNIVEITDLYLKKKHLNW